MLPLELRLKQVSELTPALRYRGDMPFAEWQQSARVKLWELLGMDTFRPCDPAFEAREAEDMGAYWRRYFSFQSEEGYRVPCCWLEPKERDAQAPVMICLQGHSSGMHISLGIAKFPGDEQDIEEERDIAVLAAARGCRALAVEQRCFGAAGGSPEGRPDCHRTAMSALLTGRTLIGERVWDVMRAVDAAEQHFGAAGAAFYCMGNSGGGTATFYAACLEPRIAKAMPSCAVCGYDGSIIPIRHCVCNFVPGIRRWFDMGDLGGLVAPRPLMVVAGREDNIFPIAATRETFTRIQGYYEAADAPANCALHVGAGGHRFYAEAWDTFDGLGNP